MDSNLLFPSRPQPTTKQVSGHDFGRAAQHVSFTKISKTAKSLAPQGNPAPQARKSLAPGSPTRAIFAWRGGGHPEASNAKPEGWVGYKMKSSPVGATHESPAPRLTANEILSSKLCPTTRQVSGHEFTRAAQPQNIAGFSPCEKDFQGLKANSSTPFTARLKSCPDTCLSHGRQLVVAAQLPMTVIKFLASHLPSRNCSALLRVSVSPWWVFSGVRP
jgi:hypothetical protein